MTRYSKLAYVCVVVTMMLPLTAPKASAANSHEVRLLWPDGAPGAEGAADGDKPSITIYMPAKGKAHWLAPCFQTGAATGLKRLMSFSPISPYCWSSSMCWVS